MSMFDSVMLDEFTMLDEGQQANEYRERKAKERDANRKSINFQKADRYEKKDFVNRMTDHVINDSKDKTMDKIDSEMMRRKGKEKQNMRKDWKTAADAYDRHLRRHPKTESALMLIAGYESEFTY